MASTNNIYTTIEFMKPDMTKVEKRIADFLLNNTERIVDLALADVASECSCGEASVIRFCRKVGCTGFTDAKTMLATHIVPDNLTQINIPSGSKLHTEEIIDQICSLYENTLQRTMQLNTPDKFKKACEIISHADSLYLFGIGDALIPCLCAYYIFRRIGIPCYFSADADMQIIHAANIKKEDVAIAISHSGKTRHVVEAMKTAKEAGAYTISISQSARSPMSKYSDLEFYNAVSDITIDKTIVAHRLAENTIVEILYAGVVVLMPEQANEILKKSAEILAVNKESDS